MTDARMLLIRHGATAANEQRPYVLQGAAMDHALSETGRRQAELVSDALRPTEIHHVYSSPMKRADETAHAIARPHGLSVRHIETITEVDVGTWEGMDWEQVMRDHPAEYASFMANPWSNPYLNGECYADVLQRVRESLEEVLDRHTGETVVVVAHQVVNRAWLAHLMDAEGPPARRIRQANTGINVIRRHDNENQVVTLNACLHLDAL